MKQGFLDNYLRMFFGAGTSGNISAMSVAHFGKCFKFNIDFKNAKKKIEQNFLVFDIIPSALVALNCLY